MLRAWNLSRVAGWMVLLFAAAWMVPGALAAVDNPEVEPNDNKASATFCQSGGAGMNALDTISGTTTGSGTGSGPTSADYFLLKTASRGLNIYRYQLVLTSATPGHTVTIRGLSQAAGVVAAGTDVTVQTGLVSGAGLPVDSRVVQWYGFGRQEQLYVRVTGTAGTTAPYTLELQTTTVLPTVMGGTVFEGTATVSRGVGNTNDTDFWMYNSALSAISDYGNDQPNTLTRTYTPGTYYIAISDSNFTNNAASPADDSNRSGNVLDFVNAAVCATTSSSLNMNAKVASAAGIASGSGTKVNPFDITWYCFSVVPNTISTVPQGIATASAAMVNNCADAPLCLQVAVAPGQNPQSDEIAVTMNLSALQGPSNAVLFDDGQHCDGLPNDNVFGLSFTVPTGVPPGLYTLPFVVRDRQGRTSSGVLSTVEVVSCSPTRPENDDCTNPKPVVPNGVPVRGYTVNALADSAAPNCFASGSPLSPGVWYLVTGTGNRMMARTCLTRYPFDTVIHVYCAQGGCSGLSCVAASNDECGRYSSAAWCSELGAPYLVLVKGLTQSDTGYFDLEVLDSGTACSTAIECLPRGACCVGTNCAVRTRATCEAAGGVYLGDGVACTTVIATDLYGSNAPFPVVIPDNDTTGVTFAIVVPSGAGTVTDLTVGVRARHTWVGDLEMTLIRGSNSVRLIDRVGRPGSGFGDSSNLDGEYCFRDGGLSMWTAASQAGNAQAIPPSIYAPSRANDGGLPTPSLGFFDGASYSGVWLLRVRDLDSGELGVIDGFTLKTLGLELACGTPCPRCPADFNEDGGVDGADVGAFFRAWVQGDPCADANQDGGVDGSDVAAFFEYWESGGC
jgi:subtilisin-like proprotein convertase family protein